MSVDIICERVSVYLPVCISVLARACVYMCIVGFALMCELVNIFMYVIVCGVVRGVVCRVVCVRMCA